jgi:galactofuranosylgalactofuranosylrhamnosyl-N-acetylglucosaminyl-diphospho-decaprenol beta-1,5/1,6-galactofuranosyltransferase
VPLYDSALVSAADGSGKNIYTRDRAKFRALLRESIRLHAELRRRWPALQREYRRAMPDLVSAESWRRIFEERS